MDKNFSKFKEFIADMEFNINPEQDIESIEVKIIQQIPEHTLPNQFYYVINNYTKECVYVSDSITELTGYTCAEWAYSLILDSIHPDDKPFIDKALYACFKLCMSPVIKQPVNDALILNYRVRHKEGHYIHILRNGYCTSMDSNNKMIHNTSMCMVISDFKHDNRQSMVLKEGNKVLVELRSDDQESINWNILSKREKEIVKLLYNNRTSNQIAKQLFISKHTVDTHRRKILKKLDIKNTTELLFKYLI